MNNIVIVVGKVQAAAAAAPSWSRRASLGAVVLAASALGGCGFTLRGNQSFAFTSLFCDFAPSSVFGAEFRRALSSGGVVVNTEPKTQAGSDVVLQILNDEREKTVVGLNAAGQVREFQLRVKLKFRLRTPLGKALIEDTELVASRDISFSETAVLSKEAEQGLLFRNMQSDLIAQLLRRLSTVKL